MSFQSTINGYFHNLFFYARVVFFRVVFDIYSTVGPNSLFMYGGNRKSAQKGFKHLVARGCSNLSVGLSPHWCQARKDGGNFTVRVVIGQPNSHPLTDNRCHA